MKDAFIGLAILATYFVLYYFWALSFGQKYPTIATILGVFPWIYIVIVSNDVDEILGIFYALFYATILVWLSILIFGGSRMYS